MWNYYGLHKDYTGIEVKTINLLKDKTETFNFNWNTIHTSNYSLPQRYGAIMKSGGFDEVARFYTLNKLHKHSHLYTSVTLISFPGRIFEIENCIPYSKQELKTYLQNKKANITTRNFPDTVEKYP
jgi:hypothetical protein